MLGRKYPDFSQNLTIREIRVFKSPIRVSVFSKSFRVR